MEVSTYYALNKEQALKVAHTVVVCECGESVKKAGLSSHRKHSVRHRIWRQMTVSLESRGQALVPVPMGDW